MSYKIITISRQFACGGSEIGKKLADRLGIKCYDREIISKVADIPINAIGAHLTFIFLSM